MKKAFITGITGQDGSYLAKLLLEKGYKVFGGLRRNSQDELHRLKLIGIQSHVELIDYEATDNLRVFEIINEHDLTKYIT